MVKTAKPTALQQAAQMCFRLNASPQDKSVVSDAGLAALSSILGSPISADDMLQFSSKLNQDEKFVAAQNQVVGKWARRMDACQLLSEDDALAFILELFSGLDHSILYDHGVTASSTLIERDYVSNSEMNFGGNMPCWTLHLTLRGEALFLNDHMEVTVGRGDMMLLHPDARYHCGLHPGADNWEHLWALFQPRPRWGEWLEWNMLDKGILHLSLPDPDSIDQVEKLFRQLVALRDDSSPYQGDLQHNRLEEILIRARQYSSQTQHKLVDKRIQRACDYIQAHLGQGFNIDDVASACNLSTSRLAHLFKEHMGVSPKSWGNNMRLQQARKLLLADSQSISRIARQVGYEDPSQFTRYFKKSMGCSPREFRQSFRK